MRKPFTHIRSITPGLSNLKAMVLATSYITIFVVSIILSHPVWSFYMLVVIVLALNVYLAYNHPVLTVVLIIFLSVIHQNLIHFYPDITLIFRAGEFNLRPWDPLLFGVFVTLLLKHMLNNYQLKQSMLRYFPLLTLLFVLLILHIIRSIGVYGARHSLGEFRTYYSYLFMVPYVAIFCRTSEQRLRMLKALMLLTFSIIVLAFLTGLLAPKISFGVKWLNAHGMLAVLYGLVVLLVVMNRRILKLNPALIILTALAGGFLIIFTAHRSVWLASAVALLSLYALREIKFTRQLQVAFIAIAVGVVAYFALSRAGYVPNEFIESRLYAFTNPKQDPTASWRLYLWQESIDGIRHNPWLGNGLGKHFELIGPAGDIIMTSPHNLYVSIPFQIGIPGLVLYLAFIAMLFFRYMQSRAKRYIPASDHVILTLGVVVLITAHAFYVAYPMEGDWVTWVYIGLAASVLVNRRIHFLKGKSNE